MKRPKMDTLAEIEKLLGPDQVQVNGTPETGLSTQEFAKLHQIGRDRARVILAGLLDKGLWERCIVARRENTGRIINRVYFRVKK